MKFWSEQDDGTEPSWLELYKCSIHLTPGPAGGDAYAAFSLSFFAVQPLVPLRRPIFRPVTPRAMHGSFRDKSSIDPYRLPRHSAGPLATP